MTTGCMLHTAARQYLVLVKHFQMSPDVEAVTLLDVQHLCRPAITMLALPARQ